MIGGHLSWRLCLRWCRAWRRSYGAWATRTRPSSGTGVAGAACRSTSLPAASRSFRWMRRWHGSMMRAASSARNGAVLRRYNRSVSKLDGPGAEAVARFQAHLRAADRSVSTVRTYGSIAGEFVAFAGTRGGLACCDAGTVGAFVATLAGYQAKTVEQKLCALRSFLLDSLGLVAG